MTLLNVKPATPDLVVLMPDNSYQRMPAEGASVAWDPYYVQLLNHGDLVEVKPEAEVQLSLPVSNTKPKEATTATLAKN